MIPRKTTLLTGVTLEYALAGPPAKPALCFVHGVGANLKQFEHQLEVFATEYRVLSLSLRGHGGSSAPTSPIIADYAVAVLARDVQALLAELGLERVHYVGNSLGGLVGYELLALERERLLSLTTFGTTAELHSPAALRITLTLLAQLLGPRKMSWLLSKTASRDRKVARFVGEMMRETSKDALILLPQTIADYDYTPTLAKHDVPMLLMRAQHDREINKQLGSTLEALQVNPNARVVELPNAGHYANLDEPGRFNELLAAFLEQVVKRAARDRRRGEPSAAALGVHYFRWTSSAHASPSPPG
jgi:3-oxoadipate enol-lactonase